MLFMKVDGVEGSADEEGHKKWIVLSTAQWGASRNITSSVKGASRETAAPSIHEVVVSKPKDNASIDLIKLALSGTGKKVIIEECRTASSPGKPFEVIVKVELEGVLISSMSLSRSGNTFPTETLTLNFTKGTWSFLEGTDKNKTSKSNRVIWDIAKGEAG
jgi:type VI protein secretion system component Hcp